MKLLFFNGFSLKNDQFFFSDYLYISDFNVAGFSFGSIKAFEYVLNTTKRVDTLQLFSPAFFQNQDEKFKKMQIIFFNKNPHEYSKVFMENCGIRQEYEKYLEVGTVEELKMLLYYVWDKDKLKYVKEKGIRIYVYLGQKDKIIMSSEVRDYFREFAEIYYFKNGSHILDYR